MKIKKTSVKPSSPKNGRKYYDLGIDFTKSSSPSFDWLNQDELMKTYSYSPVAFGFSEAPQIQFNRTRHKGPLLDAILNVYFSPGWLISNRLKQLLERIDPEAFAFCKVEVDYSNFIDPGPDYWFVKMVRHLDCVDEANSRIEYQEGIEWKHYIDLLEVKMRAELVGNAHAFRLQYGSQFEIIDDLVRDAMQSEKIFGLACRPLQKEQDVAMLNS